MAWRNRFLGTLALVFLGMSACVTMKVSHEEETRETRRPYRKILICSMNPDPAFAAQVELVLTNSLHRSRLKTDTCTHFLHSRLDRPVPQVAEEMTAEGFDAVLITQRVPLTRSSATVENVLLGSTTTLPSGDETDRTLAQSFPDIASFITAYDETRKRVETQTEGERKASAETVGVFGKEIDVDLRADLIGLTDPTRWAIAGDAEGSLHKPASDFIKSFAKTVASGLFAAGFIPKK
jgi:hypothetical protein